MQAILDALSNPGAMTGAQWLVLAIGAFIVLGSLYFVLKLIKVFRGIGKSTYTPNIGLSRHDYRGQPVSKAASDSGSPDMAGDSGDAAEAAQEEAAGQEDDRETKSD